MALTRVQTLTIDFNGTVSSAFSAGWHAAYGVVIPSSFTGTSSASASVLCSRPATTCRSCTFTRRTTQGTPGEVFSSSPSCIRRCPA